MLARAGVTAVHRVLGLVVGNTALLPVEGR